MSKKEYKHLKNELHPFFTRLLVVASSLFVASCGGGSGSTDETVSESRQMSALAVAPGGWTGRAPKYEVINGITVPPEPAPSVNNATLAGVDINKNGVRDDVERKIASTIGQSSDYSSAMVIANAYQKLVVASTLSQVDIGQLTKSAACAGEKMIGSYDSQNLKILIVNTEIRRMNIRKILSTFGGQLITDSDCQ